MKVAKEIGGTAAFYTKKYVHASINKICKSFYNATSIKGKKTHLRNFSTNDIWNKLNWQNLMLKTEKIICKNQRFSSTTANVTDYVMAALKELLLRIENCHSKIFFVQQWEF